MFYLYDSGLVFCKNLQFICAVILFFLLNDVFEIEVIPRVCVVFFVWLAK